MSNTQNKHEAHMLTYAIDKAGRFVNVDDVANGQDCSLSVGQITLLSRSLLLQRPEEVEPGHLV